ncbi:MAG: hypothetical protein SF053_03325 [Bacteroidia bacterium]|nr:hypothetical protein [Bacteroidia bacterium]
MNRVLIWAGLMLAGLLTCAQTPVVYEEKVTSAGNIAATISNLGIIGNSFSGSFNVQGFPSCEYPVNSGIEHVFEGGLWIGGIINGEERVSTGAVDDATGYATGKRGFEFTATQGLAERSSLFDSPFYSPLAVSHQDYGSVFSDTAINITTAAGSNIQIQDHRPLGFKVEFTAYNWNYSFANFFIILNFRLTNVNTVPLDSVYLGYWADGVIRNVNITPPGGTPFFNKGGNGFLDSLDMGYEFDATGDPGYTDSYIATKYLGAELNGNCPTAPGFKVRYNTWQFQNTADPLYFFPTDDRTRYDKMRQGLNELGRWQTGEIQNEIRTPNNRSNLVSVGPFSRINPGETVDIAFAIICAKRVLDGLPATANTPAQQANLITNAGWAQTAYNGEDVNLNCQLDAGEDRDGNGRVTRFILPSPPDLPRMRVVARDHAIDVYWADNAEASVDPISQREDFEGYRLYKSAIGFDVQNTQDVLASLQLAAAWDIAGNGIGFDNGLDKIRLATPFTFENDTVRYRYKYTFDNLANGWQHVIALTAFDSGDEINNLPSLESAPLANLRRVFAGKPANTAFAAGDPFVYPNPYYARAEWEGASRFEEDRKLIFANLPRTCEVRIYTVAGDLIDVFEHDEAYQGGDTRWFSTYSDPSTAVFSGGEHAWDLLSADNQIIARGLYLFVVTDRETGDKKRGKFVIIK